MSKGTKPSTNLLDAFINEQPEAAGLARLVSLAARIEPELLRSARLQLLPDSNVGLEADLWFSPIVQSYSPLALVLEPEILDALRQQLAENPTRLDQTWEVIQFVHRNAPVPIRLEEEIT